MKTDPIRLYRELTPLRMMRRFTQHCCVRPISVAEHSFYVALLATAFADQLAALDVPVDRSAVMEAALWHDGEETVLGDIPHPTKRWTESFRQQAEDMEQIIRTDLRAIGAWTPRPQLDPHSLEHLLVKAADAMELVLYVDEERAAGNTTLDRAKEGIRVLMFETLEERFAVHGDEVRKWWKALLMELERPFSHGDRLIFGGTRHPKATS